MRVRILLATLTSLSVGLVAASSAHALIYWGDGATIKRATNEGAGAHAFISGASNSCGLAVSATHIYWANRGTNTIARARLDGSEVNQSFLSTVGEPCGVTLDEHLFWAAGGTIGKADLNGGGVIHSFIPSGGSFICGVAVGTRLFWANESSGQIGRAEVNGTGVNHNFVTGAGIPCGVAVNATHVYWTNQGFESIGRATTAGLAANQTLIQSSVNSAPCGVALDPSHVYWANTNGDTIGRANLDGTQAQEDFIQSGVSGCGLAKDPLGLPADTFALGKPKSNTKKGSATLMAEVEWPGKVTMSGKGIKATMQYAEGPVTLRLRIRAKGKAAKKLKAKGRASVKARVTHTPEGGSAETKTKKVKLRRTRKS